MNSFFVVNSNVLVSMTAKRKQQVSSILTSLSKKIAVCYKKFVVCTALAMVTFGDTIIGFF